VCDSAVTVPLTPGIELRHLRYFLAVYEELHFGRAAERLHIAQPPLSQAIRKLEEHLGVQLFARTSRAVEPTAAGVVLAEEARTALASVEFAISEARRAGEKEAPLRIGFPTYVPSTRLQLFLDELRKRRAALRAEVAHLLALDQVDSLRSGRLDLGVLIHPEDHEGLDHEPVLPGERIEAFLAPDHPLSELDVLRPADVASETLVTFPRATNPAAYDRFQRRLDELGFRFRGVHTTVADLRDVLLAVAAGFGIAVGPSFAREFGSEGKLVVSRPLEPELRFPDLAVAWRKDPPRELRPRIGDVRAAAQEVYAAAG
jgi:DNA-binding transcriptional LysR family regulator